MDLFFSVREVADWIASFGVLAVIVSLLLSIVISVAGIIPPVFLSAANAVVFGIWPGLLISLLGETIGAGVTYWVYRAAIQKLEWTKVALRFPLMKPGQWRWIQHLNASSRRRQAVLLLIGYMTPFLPSSIVTFAAAAARAHFVWFMPIVLIGKLPSLTLETVIAHDLLFLSENWSRLIIFLGLLVVFVFILRRTSSANKS